MELNSRRLGISKLYGEFATPFQHFHFSEPYQMQNRSNSYISGMGMATYLRRALRSLQGWCHQGGGGVQTAGAPSEFQLVPPVGT